MGRTLQQLVGVALLAVLSGTPAVAAMCAALCLPVHHASPNGDDQGCHGHSGTGPVVAGMGDADCANHGLAAVPTTASLVASRGVDLPAVPADVRPDPIQAMAAVSSARGRPGLAVTPTLRPASASLVLRI